jgi:HD-like signal output (HDOD) protein
MNGSDVLKKIVRKKDLPSFPQCVTQILEAIENEGSTIESIADLAAHDPAIASRLLKTANSVIYNPSAISTASICESISRIGLSELRNIVASLGVIDAFEARTFPFDYLGFWKHSLTAALAAGAIAARSTKVDSPPGRENPYFISGMFHDVGIFLLANAFGKRYSSVLEKVASNDVPLYEVEKEVLGFAHPEVGAALIREWKLPDCVAVAAEFHHAPMESPEEFRHYVQIVHLADWIADHEGHGRGVEGRLEHFKEGAWYDLGIPIEAIPCVIEDFSQAAENSDLLLAIVRAG